MAWWIAWIGRGIVGAVVVSMLTQGTSEVPHGYLTTAIFIGAVDIVAAILAIAVIRQIQVRADERAMDAGTRGVGSEPSHRTTAAWHVLDHAWEIEDARRDAGVLAGDNGARLPASMYPGPMTPPAHQPSVVPMQCPHHRTFRARSRSDCPFQVTFTDSANGW